MQAPFAPVVVKEEADASGPTMGPAGESLMHDGLFAFEGERQPWLKRHTRAVLAGVGMFALAAVAIVGLTLSSDIGGSRASASAPPVTPNPDNSDVVGHETKPPVQLLPGSDAPPPIEQPKIPGLLTEAFEMLDQIHPPFWANADLHANEPIVRAKWDKDDFLVLRYERGTTYMLRPSAFFLNLDQNRETGSNTSVALPRGTELYLHLDFTSGVLNGEPTVRTGCPAWQDMKGIICNKILHRVPSSDYRQDPATQTVEFRVARSLLADLAEMPVIGDIGVTLTMRFLLSQGASQTLAKRPENFLDWYPVYSNLAEFDYCRDLNTGQRAAIVYNDAAETRYWSNVSYAQLYMSQQAQLVQAGVPHDRLNLQDLFDMRQACKYSLIVFPYSAWAAPTDWPQIRKSIFLLVHKFGVNIITVGEFFTQHKLAGVSTFSNPSFLMQSMLGIGKEGTGFQKASEALVFANSDENAMFWDMNVSEPILNAAAAGTYISLYGHDKTSAFNGEVLARSELLDENTQVWNTHSAITETQLPAELNPFGTASGRVVHFSSVSFIGNADLLWRAARYLFTATNGPKTSTLLALHPGRFDGVFITRWDMAVSKYSNRVRSLEPVILRDVARPWLETYNAKCSYFVSLGNNASVSEYTEWDKVKGIWKGFAEIGEVGSNTYTAPRDINNANIDFEVGVAAEFISGNLSIPRVGHAIPGEPITLETAVSLNSLVDTYVSTGFSVLNTGYPNAFGFFRPDMNYVYMSPNFYLDDIMFEVWLNTADSASGFWIQQLEQATRTSNFHYMHFVVHDYGPADFSLQVGLAGENPFEYAELPYRTVIAKAAEAGSEFLTAMDFHDRVRAFDAVESLHVVDRQDGSVTYTVEAKADSAAELSFGYMSLKLHQLSRERRIIKSVASWYAWNEDRVFLSDAPGTFDVTTTTADVSDINCTRITMLPPRMRLVEVWGDGEYMRFTVHGAGEILVNVNPAVLAEVDVMSPSEIVKFQYPVGNATIYSITVEEEGEHEISVFRNTGAPSTSPTTASPTAFPTIAVSRTVGGSAMSGFLLVGMAGFALFQLRKGAFLVNDVSPPQVNP